jgi:hypothetical protein
MHLFVRLLLVVQNQADGADFSLSLDDCLGLYTETEVESSSETANFEKPFGSQR